MVSKKGWAALGVAAALVAGGGVAYALSQKAGLKVSVTPNNVTSQGQITVNVSGATPNSAVQLQIRTEPVAQHGVYSTTMSTDGNGNAVLVLVLAGALDYGAQDVMITDPTTGSTATTKFTITG